ncbi:MAG TPA: hypothetical protein VN444_02840 [Verrucomicrobiae bacterium]|nr:hypothetical protein [Verrucomicrobiae bacterium]
MPSGLTTAFMYTPRFLEFDYGPGHPLRNERLGLTYGLISARGVLSLPSIRYVEPEPATDDELLVFLKPDYLKVLKAADAGDAPAGAFQYDLGTPDNPILPGIFRWSALDVSCFGCEVAGSGSSKLEIRNQELSDKAYPWRRFEGM